VASPHRKRPANKPLHLTSVAVVRRATLAGERRCWAGIEVINSTALRAAYE